MFVKILIMVIRRILFLVAFVSILISCENAADSSDQESNLPDITCEF